MADSNTFKTENSDFQKLKEKTVHGTPLLPFAKYHTDISEMLPFYPIHWHEEMEVIKVQSGKGSFCIDGKWYVGEEGDILILRPFVMHSINRLGENDMTIDAIVFNLRLLSHGKKRHMHAEILCSAAKRKTFSSLHCASDRQLVPFFRPMRYLPFHG